MDARVIRGWDSQFESLVERVSGVLPKRDLRRQTSGYVLGLLGRVERKNVWQVSEHLGGGEGLYGIQRQLCRAKWDADELRDE